MRERGLGFTAGQRPVSLAAERLYSLPACSQGAVLEYDLPTSIDTQHWRPKSVSQSPLVIFLTLLPHVSGRPQLLAVRVVRLMHVSLPSAVVCRVDGLSVARAVVRSATMGEVRSEDQKLA